MIDYCVFVAIVLSSMAGLSIWLFRMGQSRTFVLCAWLFCFLFLGLTIFVAFFGESRVTRFWQNQHVGDARTAPVTPVADGDEFNTYRNDTRRGVLFMFGLDHVLFLMGTILIALWMRQREELFASSREQSLKKQERLEQETRIRSDFLINMNRKIRTPLNAILGFIDILTSESFREIDENERQKITKIIKKNSSQLLSQINDIADAVIESPDQIEICHESATVRELILDVCETLKPHIELKQLSLIEEWGHPVPKYILTDPYRLKQVLFHLIGNAIKFTESGRIVVRCSADRSTEPSGEQSTEQSAEAWKPKFTQIQFEVVDTGIGMTPEMIDRIEGLTDPKSPYHDVPDSPAGTGLQFVARLMERLNGQLSVRSHLGQGSVFRIVFPVSTDAPQEEADPIVSKSAVIEADTDVFPEPKRDMVISTSVQDDADLKATLDHLVEISRQHAAKSSADDSPSSSQILKDCRVLLVEDVPINQMLISFQLRDVGAEVETAENGREGIEKIRKAEDDGQYYDIVLMDMQMPVLDGYETTRQLRDSGYLKPIIALTAKARLGDREKTIDAGCNDYMTKPVDREKLIETINIYWTMSDSG